MYETEYTLSVKPPFSLEFTAWVLRRRNRNEIDQWERAIYSRILNVDGLAVEIRVRQTDSSKPTIKIKLRYQSTPTDSQKKYIKNIVVQLLGLDIDLGDFYLLAEKSSVLGELANQFRGMRPTKYQAIFEALLNAISCQQVSLDAGLSVLNRLVNSFGLPFKDGASVRHAFPQPEDLAKVPDDEFRRLGYSRQKTKTIKTLALGIADKSIDLETLHSASNNAAKDYLQTLHGIGRWSAEYTLLRGLGRLDVFPGDDVGGQNNVAKLLGLDVRPSYEQIKDLLAAWQPYAGLIYFHLLLRNIPQKSIV